MAVIKATVKKKKILPLRKSVPEFNTDIIT